MRLTIDTRFEDIRTDEISTDDASAAEASTDKTSTDNASTDRGSTREAPIAKRTTIRVVQAELWLGDSKSPDATASTSITQFHNIKNTCSKVWKREDIRLGKDILEEAGFALGELLNRNFLAGTPDPETDTDTDPRRSDSIRDEYLQKERRSRTPLEVLETAIRADRKADDVYIMISCEDPELEELPWELLLVGGEHIALRENVRMIRIGRRTDEINDRDARELTILNINMSLTPLAADEDDLLRDVVVEDPPSHLVNDSLSLVGKNITWPAISRALEERDTYSVVHFAGHGRLLGGKPVLCVSSNEEVQNVRDRPNITFQYVAYIGPDRMAAHMSNNERLRMSADLAVYACCDAGIGKSWSGFGVQLLESHLPAVVSMQAPVQDDSTNRFISEFYRQLEDNYNIATAVAMARRSISSLDHELSKLEWWVPILHTKNPWFNFASGRSTTRDSFTEGQLLRERGQVKEALETWKALLIEQERDLGPNAPDTLKTLSSIATAHRDLRQMDEALEAELKLLTCQEQAFGDDLTKTIDTRRRISSINVEVESNISEGLEKALAVEREILEIQESNPATVDPKDAFDTRSRIAEVLFELGKFSEALNYRQECLDAQKSLNLNDDHPDMIRAQTAKATLLKKLGEFEEALDVEKDIERILEGTMSFEIRNNIAITLSHLDRNEEALEIEEALLADRTQHFGDEHPDTIKSRANKAVTLWELGRYEESRVLEEAVLRDRERILGDSHRETLWTRFNLAITLTNLGKLEEALDLQQNVLATLEESLALNHPDLLKVRHYMAMTMMEMGQLEEALVIQQDVLSRQTRHKHLGSEHPDTLRTQHHMARTLRSLGRIDEALQLQEDIVSRRRDRKEYDGPEALITRLNMAISLRQLGRYDEALKIQEEVLARQQEKLSADHPDLLITEQQIARTLAKVGKLDEAIERQKRVLEKQQEKLGDEHPNTLMSHHHLALRLLASGRFADVLHLPPTSLASTNDE